MGLGTTLDSVGSAGSAVWIVDDEPQAAQLAADLCEAAGVPALVFPAEQPFLTALEDEWTPAAVILDWRLERQLSAGLFLAARHRYGDLPVICWTGTDPDALPDVIRDDPATLLVGKADGVTAFEDALAWALRRAARS